MFRDILMYEYYRTSNSVVTEVLTSVDNPLVCFTSILGLSIVLVDASGETSEDNSGLGLDDGSTTLLLLEEPGTGFGVEVDGVVLLVVDSNTSRMPWDTVVVEGYGYMIILYP
jgi:hypothetical protein